MMGNEDGPDLSRTGSVPGHNRAGGAAMGGWEGAFVGGSRGWRWTSNTKSSVNAVAEDVSYISTRWIMGAGPSSKRNSDMLA
jgi:hypothetical protein